MWPDFGSGGTSGVASLRSFQKLLLCPVEVKPDSSKADSGSTSVITLLGRENSYCTRTAGAREEGNENMWEKQLQPICWESKASNRGLFQRYFSHFCIMVKGCSTNVINCIHSSYRLCNCGLNKTLGFYLPSNFCYHLNMAMSCHLLSWTAPVQAHPAAEQRWVSQQAQQTSRAKENAVEHWDLHGDSNLP